MISFLVWNMIFAYVVFKTNKQHEKIEGKLYKFHVFLAWLLLFINSTGLQNLGWAVGHPKSIFKYFYIPIGPLPAWFNLSSWAGNLICSIMGMSLAFSLAERKETARVWLLRLIPIFYFFTVTETIKGFYKNNNATISPLFVSVSISALILVIPFSAIFFFYRRDSVRNQIFNVKSKS